MDLDLPLDAEQLCQRFGEQRGRPIKLIAHPLPAGMPNGVWLVAEDADYFFYQANTSRLHRDQIIIHEFGHLIAGHQMVGEGGMAALTAAAAGAVDDEDAADAMRRTCYADEREWEAEMLASLIGEWSSRAEQGVGTSASHHGLRGLQRVLGGHDGWL